MNIEDSVSKFTFCRRFWQFAYQYHINDDSGNTVLFIVAKIYFLKSLLAIIAGIFTGSIVGVVIGKSIKLVYVLQIQIMLIVLSVLVGAIVFFIVSKILAPLRQINFYEGETKKIKTLNAIEDKTQFLDTTYVLTDTSGIFVAKIQKKYLHKRWHCYAPDGTLLCWAKRKGGILDLGLFKPDYEIYKDSSVVGKLKTKFEFNPVLEMRNYYRNIIDARIVIALGTILNIETPNTPYFL